MKYKKEFLNVINRMDSDFNWTIDCNEDFIKDLIKNEIGEKHKLYNKEIMPIAICKNKLDILAFYEELGIVTFLTIHFMGYKSNIEDSPYFEEYKTLDDAIKMIIFIYTNLYIGSRYKLMLESEETKRSKSYLSLRGLYAKIPILYDTLFKLNEYRGKVSSSKDINLLMIQDLFQFFSYDFPYKIRSIFLLSEIGNYADAAIILRTLIESFFYFKYYIIKNDGKKLSDYVAHNKKSTIRIKDIMEFIAPSYYDTVYDELCKFTHGDPLIIGLFRGNVNKKDKLKHSMYNINIDWFSYILNLSLPLINGYFNMFRVVYKNNTINTSSRLSKNIKDIEDFINKDLSDRYKLYERQRNTIELYKKIINFD